MPEVLHPDAIGHLAAFVTYDEDMSLCPCCLRGALYRALANIRAATVSIAEDGDGAGALAALEVAEDELAEVALVDFEDAMELTNGTPDEDGHAFATFVVARVDTAQLAAHETGEGSDD